MILLGLLLFIGIAGFALAIYLDNYNWKYNWNDNFIILFQSIGLISITLFFGIFIVSISEKVTEKELDRKLQVITFINYKMSKCENKNLTIDTQYYRYYTELETIIDNYNKMVSFVGNNNENKNKWWYIHFSNKIDEKKYPYLDKNKLLEIKQ